MKLNCKPGDLAVIANVQNTSRTYLIGGIVRVVSLWSDPGSSWPMWNIEGAPNHPEFGLIYAIADACLRPIRDNDGEDETLQWLDVPHKVTA